MSRMNLREVGTKAPTERLVGRLPEVNQVQHTGGPPPLRPITVVAGTEQGRIGEHLGNRVNEPT